MSLRKSPTLTAARLEANRRNSRKSTGPRTARGKGQSRMNSLRTGTRSALHENFFLLLLDAPPCSVDRVAQAILTPEQAAHPLFAEFVDMFRHAEIEVVEHFRWQSERAASRKKNSFFTTDEAGMLLKKKKGEIAVAGQSMPQVARPGS